MAQAVVKSEDLDLALEFEAGSLQVLDDARLGGFHHLAHEVLGSAYDRSGLH